MLLPTPRAAGGVHVRPRSGLTAKMSSDSGPAPTHAEMVKQAPRRATSAWRRTSPVMQAAYLETRSDNLVPLFLRHGNRRGQPGAKGENWRLALQSIWDTVKRYGAAVGVKATPHHLRHLEASTLLNRGADLSQVQDVLGHADPSTTKSIYASTRPESCVR
jgi:integrase